MLVFKDNADNIIKIKPGSGVTPGPDAPDSPGAGDLWFDTDTSKLYYYNGTSWVELANASDVGGGLWELVGTNVEPITPYQNVVVPEKLYVGVRNPAVANDGGLITYDSTYNEFYLDCVDTNVSANLKLDGKITVNGVVDGIESTIENGTIQTKIKDGNTQQLYRGTVGSEDVFFVSYAGEIYADGITTTKGVTLETDTDSDGLYVRTTGGSSNAITALADGNINATGSITAKTFDLESLDPLPA